MNDKNPKPINPPTRTIRSTTLTKEQLTQMRLEFSDIVWCLKSNPGLQLRAIHLFNSLDPEVPRE